MSAVTIKGWMLAHHWDFQQADEVTWSFCTYYSPEDPPASVVMAFPHSLEIEVPDQVNVVAGLVANLEAAKTKALADYQRTVATINDRLSKLQAITCEVSA